MRGVRLETQGSLRRWSSDFSASGPNGQKHRYNLENLRRAERHVSRGTNIDMWLFRLSLRDVRGTKGDRRHYSGNRAPARKCRLSPFTPPASTNNGALTYVLDAAGNRLSLTSTLAALPSQSFTYDPDDRISGDTFDANGN